MGSKYDNQKKKQEKNVEEFQKQQLKNQVKVQFDWLKYKLIDYRFFYLNETNKQQQQKYMSNITSTIGKTISL